MNTLYIMNVPMLSAHITNEETSGFFSGSVKKRWTIINNNIAINYGVHYLLRSMTSMNKDYKLFCDFVSNYYGTPPK